MSKITTNGKVIANFFDVSERTIRNWVQKGMPRVADGVYSPKDCFNWWNEFINESNADGDDIEEIKKRFWNARTGNEELKFEKTKGELVARDKVENAFAARAYELTLSFRALKNRLPPVVEGKSREDIQNELGKELNRILESYKRAGNFVPEGLDNILIELQEQEKEYVADLKKKALKTPKKKTTKRGKK